jgi:indole-3-glycerol phosphate synthase
MCMLCVWRGGGQLAQAASAGAAAVCLNARVLGAAGLAPMIAAAAGLGLDAAVEVRRRRRARG